MVLEVRDEAGTILSDPAASFANDGGEGGVPVPKGKLRFFRVALDPAQYALDASGDGSPLGTGVYETLNLVVRRSGRENNFKSVLETIRSLMSGGANSVFRSIPNWLVSKVLVCDPQRSDFAAGSVWLVSPPTNRLT
jgi:intron-binding protein aquarius